MPPYFRQNRRHPLTLIVALVALIAQLGVALSPLAEGRRPGMASHVERGGTKLHYAHDEATCAACQARSIHSAPRQPAVAPLATTEVATAVATSTVRVVDPDRFSQDNPRAPPGLI